MGPDPSGRFGSCFTTGTSERWLSPLFPPPATPDASQEAAATPVTGCSRLAVGRAGGCTGSTAPGKAGAGMLDAGCPLLISSGPSSCEGAASGPGPSGGFGSCFTTGTGEHWLSPAFPQPVSICRISVLDTCSERWLSPAFAPPATPDASLEAAAPPFAGCSQFAVGRAGGCAGSTAPGRAGDVAWGEADAAGTNIQTAALRPSVQDAMCDESGEITARGTGAEVWGRIQLVVGTCALCILGEQPVWSTQIAAEDEDTTQGVLGHPAELRHDYLTPTDPWRWFGDRKACCCIPPRHSSCQLAWGLPRDLSRATKLLLLVRPFWLGPIL